MPLRDRPSRRPAGSARALAGAVLLASSPTAVLADAADGPAGSEPRVGTAEGPKPTPTDAQRLPLEPVRTYATVGRPIAVAVDRSAFVAGGPEPRIELIDPLPGRTIAGETLAGLDEPAPGDRPDEPVRVDLGELFPGLRSPGEARVLYAQLNRGGERLGPPVVLRPLVTPRVSTDALTGELGAALRRRDAPLLARLLELASEELEPMRERVVVRSPRGETVAGRRLDVLRRYVFETDRGVLEFRPEPAHAPNTTLHVRRLIEGGFYGGSPFHRIIPTDTLGRPFLVQTGDPTGTGLGTAGVFVDFEPSDLPHRFGTLSLARRPDDPNSGSSQLMITLGREGGRSLDGGYTSFARLVRGSEALLAIASWDAEPAAGAAGADTEPEPEPRPTIVRAWTVPAEPFGLGPARELGPETPRPER